MLQALYQKLVPSQKPSSLIPFNPPENTQISTQDQQVAKILTDCRGAILSMNDFIRERDKQYEQVAGQMNNQIVELQNGRRNLSSKVHTLETKLEASQKTQRTLQATLGQREAENKKMLWQIARQTDQQERLMGDFAMAQRQQQDLRTTVSIQQRILRQQTERGSLQSRLNEKQRELKALQGKLSLVLQKIDTKSDGIGIPVAGATGLASVAFGFLTGGWGLLFGVVSGATAKNIAQNTGICMCMSDLLGEKQNIERQIKLVNQEIARLSALL